MRLPSAPGPSIHRAPLLLTLTTIAACSGQLDSPIAERNSPFTDPAISEWTILPDPEIVIGGSDERDGYAIGRFGGAVLLEDRLVIADGAAGEVRFHAMDGELIGRVGRSGSGPYEFRTIRAIAPRGDSAVAVWDVSLVRLTLLGRNGERQGTVLPDLSRAVAIAPEFIGVMDAGHFVFRDDGSDATLRDEPPGERRDSVRYIILDPAGSWVADWAGPGSELYLGRSDDEAWGTLPVIFGRRGIETIAGSHLVVGSTDSLVLRQVDLYGSVVQTFAADVAAVPVTPEWIELERRHLARDLESPGASLARLGFVADRNSVDAMDAWHYAHIEGLPHRRTLPAFSTLRGDAAGNVWVAQYLAPGAGERRWILVDSTFTAIARLDLPVDIDVLGFGTDHVVTLMQDDLGRSGVAIHRIVR